MKSRFPRTLTCIAASLASAISALAQDYPYNGVGNQSDGATVVIGQIGGNSRPDMLLLANDDPTNDNFVRYRLLRDLNAVGIPAQEFPSASTHYQLPISMGHDSEGLGAALTNLNADARPDLLVMVNDAGTAASPGNTFVWVVLFDLNADGSHTSIGQTRSVSGFGNDSDGAGVTIGQLDSDPRPDLIVMAYDDPLGANSFVYKVGLNLRTSGPLIGQATTWLAPVTISGIGNEGDGADIHLAQLDSDPRPDLVLVAYDDPAGPNNFRTRIGFNLDFAGHTLDWTSRTDIPVGLHGAQLAANPEGAGVAVTQLDADPRPDFAFLAYDPGTPSTGPNRFEVHWERNWMGTSASAGAGCNIGGGQTPFLRVAAATVPTQGQNLTLRLDNAVGWTVAGLLLDVGATAPPIDLGPVGLPGCNLYASQVLLGMPGTPLFPQANINLPSSTEGMLLHAQGYALGGAPGVGLSPRCDIVIGR